MAGLRRIAVPARAKRGEVITVRTLARHPMETGVRFDANKFVVFPRDILQEVVCRYNGREVFRAEWFSAVSANPYMTFRLRADASGTVEVTWTDDYGVKSSAAATIEVVDDSS